jgi:hypothetical protein
MAEVKTYGKRELAAKYGVNVNTFLTWLTPFMEELEKKGYRTNQKVFTPAQIKYLFSDDALGEPPG